MKFNCPKCGKSVTTSDVNAGKRAKCPKCGDVLTVPKLASVAPVDAQSENDPLASLASAASAVPSIAYATPTIAPPRPARAEPKKASGMGIASLVLGLIALLIAFVPLCGLIPSFLLAVLGGILGVVGLFAAISDKRTGVAFPIAGMGTCAASIIVGVFMLVALGSGLSAAAKSAAAAQQQLRTQSFAVLSPQSPTPAMPMPHQVEEIKWVDSPAAVEGAELRIDIDKVRVGKIALKEMFGGDASTSKEPALAIWLTVTNGSATHKADYRTWAGADISIERDYATLKDDAGNSYKRTTFGMSSPPVDCAKNDSIYPGKHISDVLVFEPPIDGIKFLFLELPGENIGVKGMIRLRIPVGTIERE